VAAPAKRVANASKASKCRCNPTQSTLVQFAPALATAHLHRRNHGHILLLSRPQRVAHLHSTQENTVTMALREFKAPVSYEDQQNGFELFLKDFKTSPEQTITTAMGNITIDEDDLDDDDLMDGDNQAGQRQQDKERRTPQYKYKKLLQQLADRELDEMKIDLDDLATWESQMGDDNLKLVESIEMNTKHYVDIVSRAVDKAMPQPSIDVTLVTDCLMLVLNALLTMRQVQGRCS
jgi:DNA replication licensing factor MCM7